MDSKNNMDARTLALLISSALYWYFNIYRKSKCIVIQPKCDGVKCYIAKNKSDKETTSNNMK
jgi:hypothetical protein